MGLSKAIRYDVYVAVGLLMVVGTLAKLVFGVPIDSDWFWFIAGLALVLEGVIDLVKQKQFSKKYKVVSKKEFEELWNELEASKK